MAHLWTKIKSGSKNPVARMSHEVGEGFRCGFWDWVSFGHLCLSWLEMDGVCSERGRKNC
jgi:hypothetical protein